MIIMVIILIIALLLLWKRTNTLKRQIDEINKTLTALKKLIKSKPPPPSKQIELEHAEAHAEELPSQPPELPLLTPIETPREQEPIEPRKSEPMVTLEHNLIEHPQAPPILNRVRIERKRSFISPHDNILVKIENQLIENWTGIIGAVVMVMGVSFFGIYAALKLTPVARFACIVLFSGLLFISHLYLRTHPVWHKVSSWIRSSSGAILLFACLGAGGINGLKFIDDPFYALILLCSGIVVNLYFGYAGKTQIFASLHVILSLVAVGIAPQSLVTLVITGTVVLVGVGMTYRDRWDYHLIITLASFLCYQFIWYFSLHLSPSSITPEQQIVGILVTAIIGIVACLVHYRKLYAVQTFEVVPFCVHLMNWVFMAIGFILYSTGSRWNTLVLVCVALVAAILARYARRLQIRWLFITDNLVSQSIGIFAIYTLHRWEIGWFHIISIMYIEIVIFLAIMVIEKEVFLKRIGVFLHYLLGAALIFFSLISLHNKDAASIVSNALILLIITIIESIIHFYSLKHLDDDIDFIPLLYEDQSLKLSFGGIIIPLFLLTIYAHIENYIWAGLAISVLGVLIAYGRQKMQSIGLAVGFVVFVCGVYGMAWAHTTNVLMGKYGELALYNLPIFMIPIAGAACAYCEDIKKSLVWPAIYFFTAHLVFFSYAITATLSLYLPGVLWILLSAIYLQASLSLKTSQWDTVEKGMPSRYLLQCGCILVLLFLIRHLLVHLQPGPYFGMLEVRLIIEIFALLILAYWAGVQLPDVNTGDIAWRMQPLFWEVLLAFAVLTIAIEVPVRWHPVAWMLIGLALFFIGVRFHKRLSRFRLYSVFFYWAACIHISIISSTETTPSVALMDQAWVGAILAQAIQFLYMIIFYRQSALGDVDFPLLSRQFKQLIVKLQSKQSIWIYYPFFVTMALFLFWTFDKSVLTLLWVIECFAMLILGIILKESHFRYVSIVAITGCLVRLVFFDLAQSDTITRAIVFFGSGVIMLLMNILFNKYRDRFEKL